MIFLSDTLLPNDRAHAIMPQICTTFKPTPLTDEVTDVLVALKGMTVSTDSNNEVCVSNVFLFFHRF